MSGADVLQTIRPSNECSDPSAKDAFAINPCCSPALADASLGSIDSVVSFGLVTVTSTDRLTLSLSEAVMVAFPSLDPALTSPSSTDNTSSSDDSQYTFLVTSRLEPSLNIPVAVNCDFWPTMRVSVTSFNPIAFRGLAAASSGEITVTLVESFLPLAGSMAVMLVNPATLCAVASPSLLIVTNLESWVPQWTDLVRSRSDSSE